MSTRIGRPTNDVSIKEFKGFTNQLVQIFETSRARDILQDMLSGRWPSMIPLPPAPVRKSNESDDKYAERIETYQAGVSREIIRNFKWATGEILKLTPRYHRVNEDKNVNITIAQMISSACDAFIPEDATGDQLEKLEIKLMNSDDDLKLLNDFKEVVKYEKR